MFCEHRNSGLQLLTYEQDAWHSRCLLCGGITRADAPGNDPQAGQAAARGFLLYAQHRFAQAADCFHQAFDLSGDARYAAASLVCRYGVTWCGDELQPTFGAYPLPAGGLRDTGEWRAIESAALPGNAAYAGLIERVTQLEEILTCICRQEGVSACDVFLCYRRTSANVQCALRLYRELTQAGLRVFCADVTTRGKTQEQFEAEVYHALHTAEYLVLLPGQDGLTPWLRNELDRAACDQAHRFILNTGCDGGKLGEYLPLDDIRNRLLTSAEDCRPDCLYTRALSALRERKAAAAAALLQRAAAKGHTAAQLLMSELCREGLVLPADPLRADAYLRLAREPSEGCRRQVSEDLLALESALGITRRQALIYLVADVSDTGLLASRTLARTLIAALNADRHLAGSELCLIGYDRHARVLAEPRSLAKYGSAADAATALRTCPQAGDDRAAYAAKGLRCALSHLSRYEGAAGREPFLVLLRPCATNDPDTSLEAARRLIQEAARPDALAELLSADQLDDCLSRLRALIQNPE